MKNFLLFFGMTLGLNCSAQEPSAAIELPEMNILYRGYPNKVKIAVSNNSGKTIQLIGANVVMTHAGNTDEYIVKPGEGRIANLHVLLVGDERIDTVKTMQFRCANLPDPEIYWGGSKNGHLANSRTTVLFAKYPPEIPLNATFRINGWKIFHQGDTLSGTGSNLKNAEELFKSINEKTTLEFEVECVGPDGVVRIKKARWILKPFNEQEEDRVIQYKNCG